MAINGQGTGEIVQVRGARIVHMDGTQSSNEQGLPPFRAPGVHPLIQSPEPQAEALSDEPPRQRRRVRSPQPSNRSTPTLTRSRSLSAPVRPGRKRAPPTQALPPSSVALPEADDETVDDECADTALVADDTTATEFLNGPATVLLSNDGALEEAVPPAPASGEDPASAVEPAGNDPVPGEGENAPGGDIDAAYTQEAVEGRDSPEHEAPRAERAGIQLDGPYVLSAREMGGEVAAGEDQHLPVPALALPLAGDAPGPELAEVRNAPEIVVQPIQYAGAATAGDRAYEVARAARRASDGAAALAERTPVADVDLQAVARAAAHGGALRSKIKVSHAAYASARGRDAQAYRRLSAAGALVVDDAPGCLISEGQLDVVRLISEAGTGAIPAAATGDLLTRFLTIGRRTSHRREVFDAVGVVVAPGAANSTISEEFSTTYRVLAHDQVREQTVTHRHIIGTLPAQGVQAHVVAADPRYALGKTFKLSAMDCTSASLQSAAKSFGCGKKATDLYARLIMHKSDEVPVPDLSLLFMYGTAVALDINAALTTPHMGAPVLRVAAEAGGRRDLLPALLDPAAGAAVPNFANLTNCVSEGGTHIPMLTDNAVYAHVVWSQLRGDVNNPVAPAAPLVPVPADAYTRRSAQISFGQTNYWATFPATIQDFNALDANLAAARLAVVANPALILIGMLDIAESLGLLAQLDWAVARIIGILSGPLVPLAPNAGAPPFYVASSVFGELGTLLAPPVNALPMQLKRTDMTRPMRGGQIVARDVADDTDTPRTPVAAPPSEATASASIGIVVSTLATQMNVGVDLVTALSVGGSLTYALWCVVMSVAGVEWQHVREVYGAVPAIQNMSLKRQMLEAEASTDGNGATWATRATVAAVAKLANASWPRASLPNAQLATEHAIPAAVVSRLGTVNTTFGGTDRLRVFLPLLEFVPDIYPHSRTNVTGSLAGTLCWEQEVGGAFEFRLRNLRTEEQWKMDLLADDSNLDLTLVAELNVFVSAAVRSMRRLYANAAGIQYRNIPLTVLNEVPVNVAWQAGWGAPPAWWATHSQYLNGQPWLDDMTYEVVRLNSMLNGIETGVADVAAMPNNALVWDDFNMSMSLGDAVLHDLVNNRRNFFLPRFDLAGFPREFVLYLQQWGNSGTEGGPVVMRPLEWYVLLPAVNLSGVPVHQTGKRSFRSTLPH